MEELKQLRNERGWSQRKLGRIAGVDQSTINLIEQGKRVPRLATLNRLAEALEVPVGDLLPHSGTVVVRQSARDYRNRLIGV